MDLMDNAVLRAHAENPNATIEDLLLDRERLRLENRKLRESSVDDLRKDGWSVAIHNDYRVGMLPSTFWGLSKGDRWIKGEGPDDASALDVIRTELAKEGRGIQPLQR